MKRKNERDQTVGIRIVDSGRHGVTPSARQLLEGDADRQDLVEPLALSKGLHRTEVQTLHT
jgi:hypothetical protein